jgi:hypothetical protein
MTYSIHIDPEYIRIENDVMDALFIKHEGKWFYDGMACSPTHSDDELDDMEDEAIEEFKRATGHKLCR